jgi:hypothetical protein
VIRKAMTIILTLSAIATLLAYASSRITGHEWELFEVGELWRWHADRTSLGCELNSRYLVVWYNDPTPRPGSTWGMGMRMHRFMGVKYVVHANPWGYRMVHWRVSLWVAAALLGAYPAAACIWVCLRRRRRRRRPGCCVMCGYDLTGNVSGRCPECGAEVGAG